MIEQCEICQFPVAADKQLLQTSRWKVSLGNNQAYLGRAYVSLREHKGSLSELDDQDWQEFRQIVNQLERAYTAAFGAGPFNWSCLMNNAFKEDPAYPHVHWHLIPRYKQAPEVAGITFDDPLYGHHYKPGASRLVGDAVVVQIAAKIKPHLSAG